MKLKLVEKEGARELRESMVNEEAIKLGLYTKGLPEESQCTGYHIFKWLVYHPESWISEYRMESFHPNIRGLVQCSIQFLRIEFYGYVKEIYGCEPNIDIDLGLN